MQPDTINVLEQWYRYEEIAMHFNTLIMQFRLQLLGGAGIIGTVASYLIGGKVKGDLTRHWLRLLFSSGFLLLLAAAATIDLGYYNRLLQGSVAELLEFEARHPEIQMSTRIETVVGAGKYAPHAAYTMILSAAAGFTLFSYFKYLETASSPPPPTPRRRRQGRETPGQPDLPRLPRGA